MSGGGTHSVRVQVNEDDLRQFCARPFRKMFRPVWPWLLVTAMLAGVLYLKFDSWAQSSSVFFNFLIYGLPVLILFGSVFAVIYLHTASESLAQQPLLTSSTQIRLTPEHLHFENALTSGTVVWRGIDTIEDGDRHIFFVLGTGIGYIVPKRSFDTPETAQQFFNAAQTYWQAARQGA